MRETLRQLSLTLALPVAVGVVWIVRAEPAATPGPEGATAYRVQLADLPLPTPERLRKPSVATEWHRARVIPEAPTARQRRAALPNVSAPSPIDLAVDEGSEIEIAASPSPRAAQDPSDAAIRAPSPATPGVAALIAAAPSAVSHRPRSVPASGASTTSGGPAQSTTEPAAVESAAEPHAEKSVTTEPGATALASALKLARIAALQPAPALARGDTKPIPSREPVRLPDYVKDYPKPTPNVMDRPGTDASPREKFEKTGGYAPLAPPGQATDKAFDEWLEPVAFGPSVQPKDLPRLPLEDAAAPKIAFLEQEISSPAPAFPWLAHRPTTLLMIPEPGSAVLFGAALAALASARRSPRRT